jgi:hypothetical protein
VFFSLWQGNDGDLDLCFKTASTLALIAPRTEGLVRFLEDAIESNQNYRAILFLGEIGPPAAAAAACLDSVAADPGLDDDICTAATSTPPCPSPRDDLFFFAEPDGEGEVELLVDEVVLYDAWSAGE